jgi:tetratricopeptide (TPR) repeat protein
MFCYNCGQQLPDVARFCMKCGTATITDVSAEAPEEIPQTTEVSTRAVAIRTYTGEVLPTQEYDEEAITEAQLIPYSQELAVRKSEAIEVSLDEKINNLLSESSKRLIEEDLREALRLCYQALELDKNNSEIYLNIGQTLDASQRYEEAIDAYDKAIRLGNPPTADYNVKAEALAGKGNALYFLNRYEEALKAIDEAIRLNPLRSYPYGLKSTILTMLEHPKEAEAARSQYAVVLEAEREAQQRRVEASRRRATEG